MRIFARVFSVACLGLVLGSSPASALVIDFENFNLAGGSFLSVPSPLVFSNVGGSGVDVTLNAGAYFEVYDLAKFGGPSGAPYGQSLIDWDWGTLQNPAGTDILFSSPVSDFSLVAGDFGSDDDSPLRIEAFNSANISLGSVSVPWSASASPPLASLGLATSGISRIHYSSGGSYTGSTFIDNLTFTAGPQVPGVPEPHTAALLGMGLLGLVALRRRNG